MSLIKLGFCTMISGEFDKRLTQLLALDAALWTKLNDLKFGLSNVTSWSPHWAVNVLKDRINENLDRLVPQIPTEFDELVELINACIFTNQDSQLSKPSTFARQLVGGLKSNAYGLLDDLADLGDGIIPEFNAAKLINELKRQIKGPKIDLMVPEAFQILQCMSTICGTDITGRTTSLQTFLSKYSLNPNGELNVERLLETQGISDANLNFRIQRCYNDIYDIENKIENSVTSGIDRLKRLVPDSDSIA